MIGTEDIVELELECTTFCNARCPLCYRNRVGFKKSNYSRPISRKLDDVIAQLENMTRLKFVMLVGSMSEPTLYGQFIELVKYLKGRGIEIEVCTNGDTNDQPFWRLLGETLAENDKVYFTICGATQEIHEKYRTGTSLQRIVENAASLRSAKNIDYAQCIRFAYNSNHFDTAEFKDFVRQFSHVYMTETFYPLPASEYSEHFDREMFMPCAEKRKMYDRIVRLAEMRYSCPGKNPSDCMCKRRGRFQMDVFGNIFPCYLFLEDSNGIQWDGNKEDIVRVNRECCKFCDAIVQKYAKKHDLEYVI